MKTSNTEPALTLPLQTAPLAPASLPSAPLAQAPLAPTPFTAHAPTAAGGMMHTHTVHHDGNQYFATAEMAEIFRAHAAEITERGDTELVPLLHSSGVDLLLVSPRTVFAVVAIEVGRPA